MFSDSKDATSHFSAANNATFSDVFRMIFSEDLRLVLEHALRILEHVRRGVAGHRRLDLGLCAPYPYIVLGNSG